MLIVLGAVGNLFFIAPNGRGYKIVAEYEATPIALHKATYEPLPCKFALQPLCFIAFVSCSILLIINILNT
jgi:hypothetical protein